MKTVAMTVPFVPPVATDVPTDYYPRCSSMTVRQRVAAPPTPTVPYGGQSIAGYRVMYRGVRPAMTDEGEVVTEDGKKHHPRLSLGKPGVGYPTTGPVVLIIDPGYAVRSRI